MTKHHRHRDRGLVPNRWHVVRRSSLLPSAGGQLGSTGPDQNYDCLEVEPARVGSAAARQQSAIRFTEPLSWYVEGCHELVEHES